MTTLTFSQKRYLAALYILQLTTNEVRAVHVARRLGVTAASTSVALHALRGKGLLCVSGTGALRLTAPGLRLAEEYCSRYARLAAALIRLGVPAETAMDDARLLAHSLSGESFVHICRACEKAHTSSAPGNDPASATGHRPA